MYSLRRIVRAMSWFLYGTAAQRRRVRQECARMAAGIFGDFPLSEDHKLWRFDKEFLATYRRLSPKNPYSQDRKYLLREMVRFARRVPGALAECGCYEGASAYFMAKERPEVSVHLFDSFEGLSEPNELDRTGSGEIRMWLEGDLKTSEHKTRMNLREFSNVVIHRGWIPSVLQEAEDERFCFLHIDVDIYQPTLDSLRFFYPRMNPGGVIVLDDYGFVTCPGAFRAVAEFMIDKPECVIHSPTGQGIIIIR